MRVNEIQMERLGSGSGSTPTLVETPEAEGDEPVSPATTNNVVAKLMAEHHQKLRLVRSLSAMRRKGLWAFTEALATWGAQGLVRKSC